jgi:hypothetical protein
MEESKQLSILKGSYSIDFNKLELLRKEAVFPMYRGKNEKYLLNSYFGFLIRNILLVFYCI